MHHLLFAFGWRVRYFGDVRLSSALKQAGIRTKDFGAACGVDRTIVWRWRTGRLVPTAKNAARILSELRKRGIEMKLEDLLFRKKRTKAA